MNQLASPLVISEATFTCSLAAFAEPGDGLITPPQAQTAASRNSGKHRHPNRRPISSTYCPLRTSSLSNCGRANMTQSPLAQMLTLLSTAATEFHEDVETVSDCGGLCDRTMGTVAAEPPGP